MAKNPFPISGALGIALKTSNHSFLIRSIILVSSILLLFVAFAFKLWEWFGSEHLILWCTVLFISAVLVSYLIVTSTFASLFKTNRFLDILLKDTLHELNIPLSVIRANLQMLQADEHDEKKRKRLSRIEQASHDLYQLYKEVDYFIKKEIHADVKEAFFLDELLLSVIEKQKEIANGVTISHDIRHCELFADKHGFAKVISNLLNNALKYNRDHNPIEIIYKAPFLSIKDQGIGMSESELFLAFDRYYQRDAQKEGFGIGLSLVKAYCDECKIKMRIHSRVNVGTEVILDISSLLDKK